MDMDLFPRINPKKNMNRDTVMRKIPQICFFFLKLLKKTYKSFDEDIKGCANIFPRWPLKKFKIKKSHTPTYIRFFLDYRILSIFQMV
ncbi:hypothetical protein PFDG_03170 [Plasmodium falciparum Dd2]|uniref:Uncharacterized protein n=1 Tax=Plasmodium falciparum (isolate Dd2) TaxID=57267 RepID=A0A0L7M314_PLAF4|nr:hypothetical protein PFDG_03170 [Plasmodium falciparum Dd2]